MNSLVTRALGMTFLMGVAALVLVPRAPVAPLSAEQALEQGTSNPWSKTPPQAANAPLQSAPREPRVIARDRSGQFHIDGLLNGRQTQFLIDTGADLVAIPDFEAARLGVAVRNDEFRPMLQTASGTADGVPVVIDRIDVAGTSLTHVNAVVVRGLSTMLLGQSALKRLGSVTLRGDAMVIQPS